MSADPLFVGTPTAEEVDHLLLDPLWTPSPSVRWWFLASGAAATLGLLAVTYTVLTGIGLWGNDVPVVWGFGIVNFVWWIGIGHAGTFISAFLLLLEQRWRGAINRLAEAMTLFALVNAAMFPLIHLGRPWFAYWLVPYPATMAVWPQQRASLVWDVFAISTYILVSIVFWYTGLIPDLAAARDRAPERWRRRLYGIFALGWRGSARHWSRFRVAYGLMAGVATPLVVSVHSIIGTDFAAALVPGWHSTIFPPYFVIGALHSGFAMVLVLLLPSRAFRGFSPVVTARHVDATARLLLTTGMLMTLCYTIETFMAWYGGEQAEVHVMLLQRAIGSAAPVFWLMLVCNCVVPLVLWSPQARRSTPVLLTVGVAVLFGMWLERFLIIALALTQSNLPSSWGTYVPTLVDGSILLGTLGLFLFLFLLFLRFVPYVPVSEVKQLVHEEHPVRPVEPS